MTPTTEQIAEGRALLPCPFCGDSPEWRWHSGDSLWIECDKCGCVGPQDENTSAENSEATIAAWNLRADAAEAKGEPVAWREHFQFLADLPKAHIIENNQPDRVKVDGEWYDGPLASAYLKLVRLMGEIGLSALAARSAPEQPRSRMESCWQLSMPRLTHGNRCRCVGL